MDNKEKEFTHSMCGLGWVDGEPRVAVSVTPDSPTTYMHAGPARYFAMQLLMTANEIDPQEEEEEEE